jgi:hypothetical protein
VSSVQAGVTVPVDPGTAFRVFTDEIDRWYVRGPHSWVDPERAVAIRFEDGFLREVWSDGGHVDTGRRVLLEHRGLDTLPPAVAGRIRRGYSWNIVLGWFAGQWS